MSIYIHKSHNVSCLIYHIVCPSKYRKVIFTEKADEILKETCIEISKRYEIHFLEIGTDKDHVHFLIQTVPTNTITQVVKTIKSITARELYKRDPEIKRKMWGGAIWTSGYFVNTVGKKGNEGTITNYVKNQKIEKEYRLIHKDQIRLFD